MYFVSTNVIVLRVWRKKTREGEGTCKPTHWTKEWSFEHVPCEFITKDVDKLRKAYKISEIVQIQILSSIALNNDIPSKVVQTHEEHEENHRIGSQNLREHQF